MTNQPWTEVTAPVHECAPSDDELTGHREESDFLGWIARVIHFIGRPLMGTLSPRCQQCGSANVLVIEERVEERTSAWPMVSRVYHCADCDYQWEQWSAVGDNPFL